jgi:uncharacterized protein
MNISRENAVNHLKKYIKNEKLLQHCYSSEVVMIALAAKLNEDENKWGLAGLLHDIDVEVTNGDPKTHGLVAVNILKEIDLDNEIIDAIKMHNEESTGLKRVSLFQHALAAGETITGLITATALVYPGKKIAEVKPKSIVKRMKEKAFAASVNRDTIMECEKIGIPINDFAEICLNAMKRISDLINL